MLKNFHPISLSRRDSWRGITGALALVALLGASRDLPTLGEPLDYVQAGKDLLTRHGLNADTIAPDAYQQVLSLACVNVPLGPVALYVPKDGFRAEGERGKNYPAATETLRLAIPAVLRAIVQIGRWSGSAEGLALSEKDLRDLVGMIEVAKGFDPDAASDPGSLAPLLGKDVDKREQALLDKVAALFSSEILAPQTEGAGAPKIPILVLPTRKEMVEYLCLAGVVDPAVAVVFHQPGITGWIHSYYGALNPLGRVHLLCLAEGSTGEGTLEHWAEGSGGLDAELARHTLTYDVIVAWVGARGASVPNWLALGLGFEGVLAQYGVMAGRLGADSVGDVTPPRMAFVPGGQASGGTFPPNYSALRATLSTKDLRNLLEERKRAAYARLEDRDVKDPQRKAAKDGDEVVYLNFRNPQGSEVDGTLHYGPYVGQDVSHLLEQDVSFDLALAQRAIFALVAGELVALDKGGPLGRVLAALPAWSEPFEDLLRKEAGLTPADLERAVFASLKKK